MQVALSLQHHFAGFGRMLELDRGILLHQLVHRFRQLHLVRALFRLDRQRVHGI